MKRQKPWGTCWGFAAIAAAETSILSEMGATYEEFPLDLSERQLAWFARTPLPDDAGSQAGEGMYSTNDDPNERLNVGGFPFVATSVFFSGVGPILEEQAPYRNNEGLTVMGHDGYTEYSTGGNWSLDESLRFEQPYELEASNILPSPVGTKLALDENGNFWLFGGFCGRDSGIGPAQRAKTTIWN